MSLCDHCAKRGKECEGEEETLVECNQFVELRPRYPREDDEG